MYRILIVDDEEPARELLKMRVNWESIDCTVIGFAQNGKEGFDLYQKLKPDLIITDIEMPVMDGLELIKQIRENDLQQNIIILSCHESFSYARKAMKLGVNDYLIKDSFETVELYNIISTLFKEQEIEKAEHEIDVITNIDLQKSLLLKTIIFDGLSQDAIKDNLKKYQMNLIGKISVMLVIDIEKLHQNRNDIKQQFLEGHQVMSILASIRHVLKGIALGEVCHYQENYFVVVYNTISSHSQLDIQKESLNVASQIRSELNQTFEVQSTIGISLPFVDLTSCKKSFSEALEASKRKIINGYGKNYLVNNQGFNSDDQYIKILNVKLKRVNEYLITQQFEPMGKEVKDIFLQNLKGFMQYNYLKHTNWTLLGMFIEYCSKNNVSFMEVCKSRSPWEVVMEIKTVEGMCSWYLDIINELCNLVAQKLTANYSFYVEKCVKYIRQHYMDNVSFSDLSEQLEINNAYLSRIFKKEIGKSLTEYLTDVRIEESKQMILNTNKKMYEIAELTGFSSTQRFFLAFKKTVGISPGDFKKT